MITKSKAESTLRRMFGGGPLDRLPKKTADEDLLLALAASGLDPESAYSEKEIVEYLENWLEGFTVPGTLDHVTVRRALIDTKFLTRDASGAHYTVNTEKVDSIIEPAARTVDPAAVLKAVEAEREARRRQHTSN